MKFIVASTLLSISLLTSAGCSKKSGSCDEVFDHAVSLMPAEMKDKIAGSKADAIAKCEKLSPESRQCALDAKSLEDLTKCPRK